MKLKKKFETIKDALNTIIEDKRVKKNGVTNSSSFELQFGRKPNSEWSSMSENLKSKLILDSRNLEKDVLTTEQRSENCDSRPRVKIPVAQKSHLDSGVPLLQSQRHFITRL